MSKKPLLFLLSAVITMLSGCGGGGLQTTGTGNASLPRITPLSLPVGAINSAYSVTLLSSGGKPPLAWRVTMGTLPLGLALNATTAQISGTATTAGRFGFTVRVADSTNPPQTDSQALNITINPALSIATTTLPNSAVSCRYNASLQSSGGTLPATWSIIAGALPAGLLLDSPTGRVSGTPTTAGTVTFTVQAKDSSNPVQMASKNLSLTTITANPQADCWQNTGSMHYIRFNHTATLLPDGNVLVVGGDDGHSGDGNARLMTAELYSPFDGTWTTTRSMSVARANHTATLLNNGKVLVAGGSGPDGRIDSNTYTAELYDPIMRTWSLTGGMSVARGAGVDFRSNYRGSFTATLLLDGKVLVVGGGTPSVTELYDPDAGTWSRTGDMIGGRMMDQTATRLKDGRVLVAGGFSGGAPLSTAELYDPATHTWASTGSMGVARNGHTATLLKNGKVLVVGGLTAGAPVAPQTAELYDPATGTWAPAASMTAWHYFHTATLLNDGKVLVAGGFLDGEIYDPSANTWISTPAMQSSRQDHTATLLNDGKVLVTGGLVGYEEVCDDLFGCRQVPVYTSSAEIYDPGP